VRRRSHCRNQCSTRQDREVVDFFWYGCPACAAFEHELEEGARKLPEQVAQPRAGRVQPRSVTPISAL